jgi:hypothetical protein
MAADVLGSNAWYVTGSSHRIVNWQMPLGSALDLALVADRVAALPAPVHDRHRCRSTRVAWLGCGVGELRHE